MTPETLKGLINPQQTTMSDFKNASPAGAIGLGIGLGT
jgi:hypothetical protein